MGHNRRNRNPRKRGQDNPHDHNTHSARDINSNSGINPDIPRNHQVTHPRNSRNLQKNSASRNKSNQNNRPQWNHTRITEMYGKAVLAVTEATTHNRYPSPHRIPNREHHHTRNVTARWNFNNRYDGSYKPYHVTTPRDNYDWYNQS